MFMFRDRMDSWRPAWRWFVALWVVLVAVAAVMAIGRMSWNTNTIRLGPQPNAAQRTPNAGGALNTLHWVERNCPWGSASGSEPITPQCLPAPSSSSVSP